MAAIKKAITKLPDELGDSLTQAQGNITVNSLQAMFQTHMAKLESMLAAQHQSTGATATSESATPSVTDGMFVCEDGRSYALPEGYVLQKGTL